LSAPNYLGKSFVFTPSGPAKAVQNRFAVLSLDTFFGIKESNGKTVNCKSKKSRLQVKLTIGYKP